MCDSKNARFEISVSLKSLGAMYFLMNSSYTGPLLVRKRFFCLNFSLGHMVRGKIAERSFLDKKNEKTLLRLICDHWAGNG